MGPRVLISGTWYYRKIENNTARSEPSDQGHGQQERDDHAHADKHIDENNNGGVLDGHDARRRFASMPLYGQSSGSPGGFMH